MQDATAFRTSVCFWRHARGSEVCAVSVSWDRLEWTLGVGDDGLGRLILEAVKLEMVGQKTLEVVATWCDWLLGLRTLQSRGEEILGHPVVIPQQSCRGSRMMT